MTSPRLVGAALAVLSLANATVGCASRKVSQSPAETASSFAAAVRRRDAAAAYDLMSASYRRRVSREEFARAFAELDADDAARLERGVESADGALEIPTANLGPVRFRRDGGSYRLDRLPVEPWGQATPRQALTSFVRALAGRRWDILLELAPEADRAKLDAARLRHHWEGEGAANAATLLEELRLHADDPIDELGDEATLVYEVAAGRPRAVRFLREAERWRIAGID